MWLQAFVKTFYLNSINDDQPQTQHSHRIQDFSVYRGTSFNHDTIKSFSGLYKMTLRHTNILVIERMSWFYKLE